MKNSQPMKWFLKQTCKLTPNVIDWIRSVYFSFFCSLVMMLALKYSVFSNNVRIAFFFGLGFLVIGFIVSIQIANRFKGYEKLFDSKSDNEKLAKPVSTYYFEKECERKGIFALPINFSHFLFLTIGIIALIPLIYGGINFENKSAQSSNNSKEEIQSLRNLIEKQDSSSQLKLTINEENEKLKDSLVFVKTIIKTQEKHIDSLNNVISKQKRAQKR